MDDVKLFKIEVDLDSISRLYDYQQGLFLNKPESGWNVQELADAYRKVGEPDETMAHLMSKMYKAHLFKGRFEGDKTKDSKDNDEDMELGSVFDSIRGPEGSDMSLPPFVLPVLRPGDSVRGQVKLEVVKEIEAENVIIKFKGHANTCLGMYNGQTYYEDRGEIVYAREGVLAWQKEGGSLKVDDDDEEVLVKDKVQTGKSLAPGSYTFPYNFKLPESAIQSVPPIVHSCNDSAALTYYIKATIKKGKTFKRGNVVANQGIWVEKPFDLAKDPSNLASVNEEKEQSTGIFTKGKVVCRASLPCRGFIRGSDNHVPLRLEVDNQSGGDIDNVKAYVQLHGHYRAKNNRWHCTKSTRIKGHKAEEGVIASGMCPQLNMKVPLEFKENCLDGNLIPVGNLEDCDIIDVKYELIVILKRSGLHRNVEMTIPILIGTENSSCVAGSVYPSLSGLKVK